MDIIFSWRGVTYTVSPKAYGTDLIVLPDCTVLKVESWRKSSPPQIKEARIVPHQYGDHGVKFIATYMAACPASVQVTL